MLIEPYNPCFYQTEFPCVEIQPLVCARIPLATPIFIFAFLFERVVERGRNRDQRETSSTCQLSPQMFGQPGQARPKPARNIIQVSHMADIHRAESASPVFLRTFTEQCILRQAARKGTGAPVTCQSRRSHLQLQSMLLAPGQSCFISSNQIYIFLSSHFMYSKLILVSELLFKMPLLFK